MRAIAAHARSDLAGSCRAAAFGDHQDLTARPWPVHEVGPNNCSMHRRLVTLLAVAAASRAAADPETPARTREQTIAALFRWPYHSSRLFAMPSADVVGAYVL